MLSAMRPELASVKDLTAMERQRRPTARQRPNLLPGSPIDPVSKTVDLQHHRHLGAVWFAVPGHPNRPCIEKTCRKVLVSNKLGSLQMTDRHGEHLGPLCLCDPPGRVLAQEFLAPKLAGHLLFLTHPVVAGLPQFGNCAGHRQFSAAGMTGTSRMAVSG
ncbi:hypothetical protein ABZ412_15645 [Nocardia sp. NPDC005746]|uniref:hypothetical protein n=1 Tax=Nocardia sp. NPDC005746 TaxID=3157062 RepID=UPI0034112589